MNSDRRVVDFLSEIPIQWLGTEKTKTKLCMSKIYDAPSNAAINFSSSWKGNLNQKGLNWIQVSLGGSSSAQISHVHIQSK